MKKKISAKWMICIFCVALLLLAAAVALVLHSCFSDPTADHYQTESTGENNENGQGEADPNGGENNSNQDAQDPDQDKDNNDRNDQNVDNPNQGDDEPNQGGDEPNQGDDEPNQGDDEPNQGDDEPNQGGDEPNQGDDEPNQGDDKPNQGDDEPNQGGDEPNQGDDEPNQGDDEPNQGGDEPNQGGDEPNQGGDEPNQGDDEPNQGDDEPNQGDDKPNQGDDEPNQGDDEPNQGGDEPNQGGDEPNQGGDEPNQGGDEPNQGGDEPDDNTSVGIQFPYQVPNYGLVIERIAPYTGKFVEDGTNAQVQNVAMLLVRNTGAFPVEFARLQVEYNQAQLVFEVSALPAGQALVVQEKTGKTMPEGYISNVAATLAERTDMEMSASKIRVTDNGNNTLTITNLTGETIPTVRVFYKYYMQDEEIFVGGIAFTVRITRLGSGASVTVQPSHYTSQTSRVVMVLTYDQEG